MWSTRSGSRSLPPERWTAIVGGCPILVNGECIGGIGVAGGDWQADLDRWLAPFVAALRHKTRARMCPAYIAGLIGPGDRKSVQPMATRIGEVGYDQLHHFVAAGVWDSAPLEAALLKKAARPKPSWCAREPSPMPTSPSPGTPSVSGKW